METDINILEVLKHPLFIALITFIVTFATTRFVNWREKNKKLKLIQKGLLDELKIIGGLLQNTKEIYESKINHKDAVHSGYYVRDLTTPIYDTYYKDICLNFNDGQRSSFQLINTTIKEFNQHNQKLFDDCPNPQECASKCFSMLTTTYRTIRQLELMIIIHLEHPNDPFYDIDNIDQRYDNLNKEVDVAIRKRNII